MVTQREIAIYNKEESNKMKKEIENMRAKIELQNNEVIRKLEKAYYRLAVEREEKKQRRILEK